MKNQNTQEILNEILLCMRYDSSKTLSENKEIILEQGGSYYTPSGKLIGYPGVNNVNIPASDVYPEIKNNQYPQTADFNKIQTALAGRNINKIVSQMPKTSTNQSTPFRFEKPQIPQSDYLGPTGEFARNRKNIVPPPKSKLNITGTTKPNISYKDATNLVTPKRYSAEEIAQNKKNAQQRTPKTVNVGFDDSFEIPKNATVYQWSIIDHNDLNSFKQSVTFKNSTIDDWSSFILFGNKYQKQYVMPFDKVKGFTFESGNGVFTFKRTVTKDEFLNEFGTIINGKYYKYVKSDFLGKTFWEENGPLILNLASIAVALLGPATWPLLLTSAGLDLTAAKMQYEQGDIEGANLSALLSLTPFLGKFGIKVPKADADNLSKKFINAKTTSDVDLIILNLSKPELNTLKSLRELGDINKLTSMVNDPQVKSAIKSSAKKSKGIATASLEKGVVELGVGGGIFFYKLSDLKIQEIENLKRSQVFNKIKGGILESTNLKSFMTDEEKQTISEDISEILPLNSMIEKMIQQSDIIRRSFDKSIKKSTNDILIKQKNTIDDIDKQIKFLEEQNNKLKELGDSKLSEEEKNQLTN
jgi:hypothetical protein